MPTNKYRRCPSTCFAHVCVPAPQVDLPSLRRIRKVSLGACHAMATRADERVHVWGSDRAASGCLGGAHLGAIGGGATTAAGGGLGAGGGAAAGAGAGRQQPLVVSRPAMFRYWFTDVACGFAHSAGGRQAGCRPGRCVRVGVARGCSLSPMDGVENEIRGVVNWCRVSRGAPGGDCLVVPLQWGCARIG